MQPGCCGRAPVNWMYQVVGIAYWMWLLTKTILLAVGCLGCVTLSCLPGVGGGPTSCTWTSTNHDYSTSSPLYFTAAPVTTLTSCLARTKYVEGHCRGRNRKRRVKFALTSSQERAVQRSSRRHGGGSQSSIMRLYVEADENVHPGLQLKVDHHRSRRDIGILRLCNS